MHLKLRKLLALCMTGVMMISSELSSFPIYAADPSPSVTIEYEGSGTVYFEDTVIDSGDTITATSGTEITLDAVADEGYLVQNVTINDRIPDDFVPSQNYSLDYVLNDLPNQNISIYFEENGSSTESSFPNEEEIDSSENSWSSEEEEIDSSLDSMISSDSSSSLEESMNSYDSMEESSNSDTEMDVESILSIMDELDVTDVDLIPLLDEYETSFIEVSRDYIQGNMGDWKDFRFDLAQYLNLTDYLDEEGFLPEEFFEQFEQSEDLYFVQYLNSLWEQPEVEPLSPIKRFAQKLFSRNSFNVTVASEVVQTNVPVFGHYMSNGAWYLSGIPEVNYNVPAFCANWTLAEPVTGMTSVSVEETTNQNLIKALYYGYGGPGNILGSLGFNPPQQTVITDDLCSYALIGECISSQLLDGLIWKSGMGEVWNKIMKMPMPKNFKAYLANFAGTGNNWQNQPKPYQPLAFGVGTKAPPESPKSSLDPLGLLLVKMDEDWHKPTPQGDASLAGAIFKFEFWEDPNPESTGPTSTNGAPTRTWYFKTNENGIIMFDPAYKVSGDDFYYEEGSSDPGVPKGVMRITEDTPPPGYNFANGDSDHPMPIEIQINPGKIKPGSVTSYVTPEVHEPVIKGELHLRKVITDGHESELVEYEEGAEFVAIAKKYVTKWGSFEKALEHLGEYGPQEWERYTTDKDGYGQPEKTGKLAYGRYVVKQTKVGKEEHQILKDPFEVNFDHDGQVIDIVINNIPNKYWTRIVKKDADNGKTVTLNHATFQIIKKKEDGSIDRLYGDKDSGALVRTDENGVVLVKSGANNWYDHFTTRSDGTLVSIPRNFVGTENDPEGSVAVPVQLPYGKYVLKETNVPDGYLHGKDLEFTLKEEFALEQDEDGDRFLTLEFENPKPKGKIIITKTFEDPNNIMHGVVSFDLIVRDDIIDPADGKILYHAGDLYGHYELKDNRKIVIDNLPMGVGKSSFIVKEHSTYENYQLDLSEKVVIFEQKDKESGEVDLTTPEYVDDSAQFHNKLIKISTTAKAENGTHDQQAKKGKTTLTDTVAYEGLIHNRDYTLRAELMDKETGKPLLDAQGAPYKVEHTFTAIEENGTVDVPFVIDSEKLAGKDVVFFETLLNGMHGHTQCEIASHKDIKDENQTLHFFEIKTKAQSESKTNEQQIKDGVVKLTDTVSYKGLRVGTEYVLKGTLMDKSTGGKLMKNGKPVTARAKFTPKETEGTVDVVFEVDLSGLKPGNSLVVFEELMLGDVIIGEHKDLEDQAQTVKLIDIHTEAQSGNKHHLKQVEKDKTTLVDKVSYEGLTVGEKYVLKGVLMDQKSGEKVLDGGKEITGEMTFTPKTSSGDVNVEFKFNSKALIGKTVVVFETLEHNKIPVAKHEDLKDEKQTLYIFDLKTNAVNKNKSHEQQVTKEKVTITDTVSYDGLKVGEKYTLKGTLMDKETGRPIFINADNVKAESKFTPKQSKGTVEVKFEVDVHNLEPDTSLVVFEELYIGEEKVGSHSDINAKDQTINIIDLKTKVESSKGSQVELAGKDVVLKDKVTYEGLMVDEEYVLKGVLMDKKTGKPLQVNGKEVTAEKSCKPKASKGEVIVEFKVDSSKLAGKKVVVFETLIHNGIEVGKHADINDKDQTMEFKHYEIKVNKVDSVTKKNIVSEKFEFTMYKDADCKQEEKTLPGSKDTGIATFEVKDGTWYIKESKAPKGYILSDEVVKVEVKDAKLFVNDKEVQSDENYVYSIVYENSLKTASNSSNQPNKKPGANTATQTNALLWGGILAVAVCGLGIAFVIKKKSKK